MSRCFSLTSSSCAFTLAELLIALAILGVIATFTIPKVLQNQQDQRFNSTAKEAAAMMSAAYDAYVKQNGYSTSLSSDQLTPYLNYVRLDSTGSIDYYQTAGTQVCSSGGFLHCVFLHNGAVVRVWNVSFSGSGSTNAIFFLVDPDGKVTDGTTNGPGKAVKFFIYYNGRVTTYGNLSPNTVSSDGTRQPTPANDPPWFHWD